MSNVAAWNGWKRDEIFQAVLNGERPDLQFITLENPSLEDIMKKCWKQDPIDRPDFLTIHRTIIDPFSLPSTQ